MTNDHESIAKALIKQNTILWLAAMILAPLFHLGFAAFASGPVKFPWPIIMPMLMVGLLIGSNNLIAKAAAAKETSED